MVANQLVNSTRTGLRLGYLAPDFKAETTQGPISFHDWIGDSWAILFSHPADFTPVCTTELGEVAKLQPEFAKRKVKTIGLSCNELRSHGEWIKDINELSNVDLQFPIIADPSREIAHLYDMLDEQDLTNLDDKGIPFTVRSVYVIDPKKTIRLTLTYPASTGRHFGEVLRIIDSLQVGLRLTSVLTLRILTELSFVYSSEMLTRSRPRPTGSPEARSSCTRRSSKPPPPPLICWPPRVCR